MVLNPLKGIVGALIFIIGMLVFLMIWSPIVALFPTFLNADTMAMTTEILGIIYLIPGIVVFVGIVTIVSAVFEPGPQRF